MSLLNQRDDDPNLSHSGAIFGNGFSQKPATQFLSCSVISEDVPLLRGLHENPYFVRIFIGLLRSAS